MLPAALRAGQSCQPSRASMGRPGSGAARAAEHGPPGTLANPGRCRVASGAARRWRESAPASTPIAIRRAAPSALARSRVGPAESLSRAYGAPATARPSAALVVHGRIGNENRTGENASADMVAKPASAVAARLSRGVGSRGFVAAFALTHRRRGRIPRCSTGTAGDAGSCSPPTARRCGTAGTTVAGQASGRMRRSGNGSTVLVQLLITANVVRT